jgi:amino acid permease
MCEIRWFSLSGRFMVAYVSQGTACRFLARLNRQGRDYAAQSHLFSVE